MVISEVKRISKNSLGFGIGVMLTQAISFFLLPVYTRYLTPADYGIISLATVVASILSFIFLFGMTNAVSRFYYDYRKDKDELKEYLSTICITVFSASFALSVILYLFGDPLFIRITPDLPQHPYISLVIWTTFLGIPLSLGLVLLQVRERALAYSLINVARFLVSTLLIIAFVVFLREGALGSLRGQFLSAAIFFLVGLAILKRDLGLHYNESKLKESLAFSIPLIPHEAAGMVMRLIDRLFLNKYSTLSNVGLYSLGYQIGSILSLFTMSINLAWVPFLFSSARELGDKAKPTFSALTTYYTAFILFLAIGMAAFANDVLVIMTTPKYYNASEVIPIITLGFVFNGLYFMVVNQLFYLKKTAHISSVTFSSAFINVVFNAILIPRYDMKGAAYSMLISYAYTFFLIFYFSHKFYPIPYDYGKIMKIFAISALIYIATLFTSNGNLWIDIGVKSLLICLYPVGLVATKVISINELKTVKLHIFERRSS